MWLTATATATLWTVAGICPTLLYRDRECSRAGLYRNCNRLHRDSDRNRDRQGSA